MAAAKKGDHFTPRDLVSTQVDSRTYLKLYPKRTHLWTELESNLAFHINSSALENSSLKKNAIINSLAEQMGTTTQVNIHLQQYETIAKNQLFNPAFLTVLSYHNRKGAVIEDAQHFHNGEEVLLPAHERPQGIYFIKFRCNLDFTSVGVDAHKFTYVDYYAKLPTTSNASSIPIDLTKASPSDAELASLQHALDQATDAHSKCTAVDTDPVKSGLKITELNAAKALTEAKAKRSESDKAIALKTARYDKIKSGVNFNKPSTWFIDLKSKNDLLQALSENSMQVYSLNPFLLAKPAFDSNTAEMETKKFEDNLQSIIFDVAYEPLKKVIFNYICPNLKDEPFQLFQSVCQESIDPTNSSATVKISVEHYSDTFNSLMRSLPSNTDVEWSVDVHQYFVKNLAQDIRDKMENDGYKAHLSATSKQPFAQIKLLDDARKKALAAQKSLQNQASMIRAQIENSHGFLAMSNQQSNHNDGNTALFSSPAENTINRYKGASPGSGLSIRCWGCGDDTHRWWCNKQNRVICPKANDPQCIKNASEARERLRQRNRDRANSRKKQFNSRGKAFLRALFSDMDDDEDDDDDESSNNNKKMKHISKKNKNNDGSSGSFTFLTAHAFIGHNGKEPLPISLHPNLPHIRILLGESDATFNPAILGLIDTGATLTLGYYKYILGICKAFPHLVKSIVWAEDKYCPIHLSGVVSDKDNTTMSLEERRQRALLSTLSAVVTFHMPYFTKNNANTSFSIAIGKGVSVNLLVGMSFIRNIQLVIDPSDNIAEAKMLECEPFEIVFKPASRGEPNAIPQEFQPDQSVFKAHQSTLKRIEDTYAYLEGRLNPSLKKNDNVVLQTNQNTLDNTKVVQDTVMTEPAPTPAPAVQYESSVKDNGNKGEASVPEASFLEYLIP